MAIKYFKVNPNPYYVRVIVPPTGLEEKDLKDLIQETAIQSDAGQTWKDDISYGHIVYEEATKKQAQEGGFFNGEGNVRMFMCPKCGASHCAEEWTDTANATEDYPDTMCPIEFEDDYDYRSEYLWNCPTCGREVYGSNIEEVEP